MPASQFSNAQWPQTSVAFKGNLNVNGYPAGPKDSMMILGGFLDSNDPNNASLTVGPFGSMVSALAGSGDNLILGIPSGSYLPRGFLVVDESILYNEPAKSTGYALGLPCAFMVRGYMRLSSWTTIGSGSLATPYLGCVPIVNNASGYIEFQPSGTVSAPAGFSIVKGVNTDNVLKFVDIDPLLGSSSAGGVMLYLKVY